MKKRLARIRRSKKTRVLINLSGKPRLSVHRSNVHIYASVIVNENGQARTVVSASTNETELRSQATGTKSEQAKMIGKIVAERAVSKGIKQVAFDRSGFKYHGRVKALADAARENGLEF